MLRDLTSLNPAADIEIFMNIPGVENEPVQTTTQYVDPFDDVFGSAPSSPALAPQDGSADNSTGMLDLSAPPVNHPSDIPRLRSIHVTNGYREGIAASKEKHLQEGFDEGYGLGAEVALKAGHLIGALEGLHHALADPTNLVCDDALKGLDHSYHGLAKTKQDVEKMLKKAEEEFIVQTLFSSTYFGEDGIWLYHVPGQEDESEVTFVQVAEAHPLIKKWTEKLSELCQGLNLILE